MNIFVSLFVYQHEYESIDLVRKGDDYLHFFS